MDRLGGDRANGQRGTASGGFEWEDIMGIRGRHSAARLGRRIARHWAIPIALVFSLMAATVAWADNVIADGDGLAPVTAHALAFGTVCQNNTVSDDALLAVTRQGNSGTPNVFKDGSTVTVSVSSVSDPRLSASLADSAILIPADWGALPNNSVTTDTARSLVTLAVGPVPGSQTGQVSYAATGVNSSNNTITRTTLLDVSWTTVACDTTPPIISPTVSGTLGNNGWYTSNVSVSWMVTDAESAVTSTSGCETSTVTADTAGATFTCSATSGGGTASQSVMIKRDATAPSISEATSPPANGNGWNNTDVTVAFSCADATSGVASCGPDVTLGSEGAGQSASGTAIDHAGNTASATVGDINIDKTAPAVTATATPAPNLNGWHSDDLVVSFSATDGGSGVLNCDPAVSVTSEGAQIVSGSCVDRAGNSGTASITINLDKTNPTITATRTAPNSYGWNNTDVFVDYDCLDAPSGIATCGPDETVTAEGAGSTSTGIAVDLAGRTASLTVTDINIDKTAPTVDCTVPDGSIWYGADVTVSCTATDNGAGLEDAGDAAFTLSTSVSDGAETSFASTGSHTVTDKAGNGTTVGPFTFKVDRKAPEVSCEGPDGAWHAGNVSFVCSATDGGSGLDGSATATLSTSVSAGAETDSAYTGTHTFVDEVGNSTVGGPVGPNKIDRKAPTITFTRTPAANTNGWNNTDVAVTFTCTDGGSGVASCGPDATLSGEGARQSATGEAVDEVGNTASATANNINIDKTKPTATATATPAPNGNGWNNTDVTVTFTGTDGLSGIDFCDTAVVLSGEGADQSATGTCTDQAGNVSEPATADNIDIDKTAPDAAPVAVPVANVYGWNNTVVVVNWNWSDAGSGIDPANCTTTGTTSGEGLFTLTAECGDLAGNSAGDSYLVRVDTTSPAATPQPETLPNSNGWYHADVTVDWNWSDGGAGLDATNCTTSSTSSGDGVLTLTAECSDLAGNTGLASYLVNIDKTAPAITVTRPGGSYVLNESVTIAFDCEDTLSGVASCVGSQADGALLNTSSVGTKAFGVDAADLAGNSASYAGSYQVVYATGTCLGAPGRQVLQPVNAGGTSVFKKGSTVPIKFRVCDANGNSIGTPGVVTNFRMTGVWSQTQSFVNEDIVSTTPDAAFRWSATDQQWIFNLNTKNLTAGRTYAYSIDLADGTNISFCFGLK
jgi:hypothetical protein